MEAAVQGDVAGAVAAAFAIEDPVGRETRESIAGCVGNFGGPAALRSVDEKPSEAGGDDVVGLAAVRARWLSGPVAR